MRYGCRHIARRQVAINAIFIRLYTKKAHVMLHGVRSGLGSLAKSSGFDVEDIAIPGWQYLLKRLTAGTFTPISEKAESGFIRTCGKNCGWAAAQNYRRRLKLAPLNYAGFEFAAPGCFATTAEDLAAAGVDDPRAEADD